MDYALETTFDIKFTSRSFSTGIPTTLSGTPEVVIYEDNSTTEITGAETLTVDFDSVTGLNSLRIAATAANGFESGKSYSAVISAGTVDSVSVVGETVYNFSIERTSALRPTVAGRTIDVTGNGTAGIDWGNVENQNAFVVLSLTQTALVGVASSVTAVAAGGIASGSFAAGAVDSTAIASGAIAAGLQATGFATPTNITAASGVTVSAIGANVITATSIASNAITSTKVQDGFLTAAKFASGCLSIVKFAADIGTTAYASNPLAKAVWERLLSAMTTSGTAGKKLSDQVVQTGDSFARIGAGGAGLTSVGDTRLANLDATISSRMASYTHPTGFLAATFPTTIATPTNVTDAQTAIIAEVNANEAKLDTIISTGGAGPWTTGVAGTAPTEAEIFTYFTSLSREDSFKATGFATPTNVTDAQTAIVTEVNANEAKLDTIISTGSTGPWTTGAGGGDGLTGPYTVTITVSEGVTPIEGATVRMKKGAQSETQATDVDGIAVFTVEAGTWEARLKSTGYVGQTNTIVVVAGDVEEPYTMVPTAVTEPDDPLLSLMIVKCVDEYGVVEAGVKVKAKMMIPPAGTGLAYPNQYAVGVSGVDGISTIELSRGATYQVVRGSGPKISIVVPDAGSFDLDNIIGT